MSLVDLLRAGRRFPGAERVSAPTRIAWGVAAVLHIAALVLMFATEVWLVDRASYLFTWALFNFVALLLWQRPAFAAAVSLGLTAGVIILSRLKHDILWMTASFIDVLIIDIDSITYLLTVIPGLWVKVILTALVVVPLLALIWRLDGLRIRRRVAALGAAISLAALTATTLSFPQEYWEAFHSESYLSKFSRSGVTAVSDLILRGYIDAAPEVAEQLNTAADQVCQPAVKPPHIILVHDESSFDARALPGVRVQPGYGAHFKSFDGKQRSFVAEGAGGPSWFAEYNVLAGLSSRSYGNFSYFVTKVAAGRVHRGLPQSLRRCGYKTLSLYPSLGAFMSARTFQSTMGVERFMDSRDLGTRKLEPDGFFYDAATRLIERERGGSPLFVFVYLGANHFPWSYRYRPDLLPNWRDPGNMPRADEYLRRQQLSFDDYAAFKSKLKAQFPGEPFLIVRFGDHQPDFAAELIEPGISDVDLAKRLQAYDPRYFTTYYAIDAINFKPIDVSSAHDTLEGPYLPLVVQEAAGLPLDASFREQKKILRRCNGAFYLCDGGNEARRFNRMLIDAGLITGL